MAHVVQPGPIDKEPCLHVRMSSGWTAGSGDTQLELRLLEMEERRMTVDLEAPKLKSEER